MSTNTSPGHFYDSEAALRLVDTALSELHGEAQGASVPPQEPTPDLLVRTYSEIKGVLTALRKSRLDIAEATVQKIQATQSKLNAVTSATEVATIDILDGLDRAQTLIDELATHDGGSTDTPAAGTRDRLRDELFQITGSLQFQDITTQQLNHASSVLVETETRLQQLAELFYPAVAESSTEPAAPVTYDPAATVDDAGIRQALADQIFAA